MTTVTLRVGTGRLVGAVLVNALLTVAQVAGGLLSGSLSLVWSRGASRVGPGLRTLRKKFPENHSAMCRGV